MPPAEATMLPRELTLIVAATTKMGIGRGGTLPWTGLKKEMAYFARVTKRSSPGKYNAVIMGRKTWDSIPSKFRPLKDRLNIVVTRNTSSIPSADAEKCVVVDSLEAALGELNSPVPAAVISTSAKTTQTNPYPNPASTTSIDKAFIIGGAQLYSTALNHPATKRILLTRVLTDYECDTHFPITLKEKGEVEGEVKVGSWTKKSIDELDAWVGESVELGVVEEAGTKYIFEMWERADS